MRIEFRGLTSKGQWHTQVVWEEEAVSWRCQFVPGNDKVEIYLYTPDRRPACHGASTHTFDGARTAAAALFTETETPLGGLLGMALLFAIGEAEPWEGA